MVSLKPEIGMSLLGNNRMIIGLLICGNASIGYAATHKNK